MAKKKKTAEPKQELQQEKTLPSKPLRDTKRPKPVVPVSALASATGTPRIVLESIKKAFNWDDKTLLTRAEFVAKRDQWLKRPASEV